MGPLVFVLFVAAITLSFMISSEHNKRMKKQEGAHKTIIGLKEKGSNAEICPICHGKGSTRIIFWWQPHESNCSKCGGVGYLCEIKHKTEENNTT